MSYKLGIMSFEFGIIMNSTLLKEVQLASCAMGKIVPFAPLRLNKKRVEYGFER